MKDLYAVVQLLEMLIHISHGLWCVTAVLCHEAKICWVSHAADSLFAATCTSAERAAATGAGLQRAAV